MPTISSSALPSEKAAETLHAPFAQANAAGILDRVRLPPLAAINRERWIVAFRCRETRKMSPLRSTPRFIRRPGGPWFDFPLGATTMVTWRRPAAPPVHPTANAANGSQARIQFVEL